MVPVQGHRTPGPLSGRGSGEPGARACSGGPEPGRSGIHSHSQSLYLRPGSEEGGSVTYSTGTSLPLGRSELGCAAVRPVSSRHHFFKTSSINPPLARSRSWALSSAPLPISVSLISFKHSRYSATSSCGKGNLSTETAPRIPAMKPALAASRRLRIPFLPRPVGIQTAGSAQLPSRVHPGREVTALRLHGMARRQPTRRRAHRGRGVRSSFPKEHPAVFGDTGLPLDPHSLDNLCSGEFGLELDVLIFSKVPSSICWFYKRSSL